MTTRRAMRGGAWTHVAQHVRCAAHDAYVPDHIFARFSFRPVAKALPPVSLRVLRGGSGFNDAQYVRCAIRHALGSGSRSSSIGFRPVAKAKP